ncbi:hypothetical protein [Sphingobium baderi]|uniref:hypothetical protein n=1 Tax=Sphingobium baderi TaxID=1332080 RepID=UPI002B416C80|nr:hypothetical protein [Sphingobium baderi]WRD76408.1 hypothetical protein QQ987_16915 [Sphingobium baderi]
MRAKARMLIGAALLSGCITLMGCGGGDKGGNVVQMKDMEVVDGTATDAMTDLDGVQSEGTAAAMPVGNASNAGAAAKPRPRKEETGESGDESAEVVADQ